jgi:hypothetical protein
MRSSATALCCALSATAIQASPRYIDVTAEKPQKHIHVTSSNLAEGFWAFSIDVSMKDLEIPETLGAYLILRNDKGNLLSTMIKPTPVDKGVMNFYAAVHLDLLQWAQVEMRDDQTEYSIKLESFQRAAQAHQFMTGVSQDLMKLKSQYPQLAEFSVSKAMDVPHLKVSYGFHTHRAEHGGGWTAGVPNPDPDGLWFYIDLHDPGSAAQIHTQPMIAPVCFGANKVSFLILDGPETKPVSHAIWDILNKRGAKPCRRSR